MVKIELIIEDNEEANVGLSIKENDTKYKKLWKELRSSERGNKRANQG